MKISAHLFLLLLAAGSMHADSLWVSPANSEHSMFADHKACRRGDILTVVVSESAATQSSQSKTSNNTSTIDSGVAAFLVPKVSNFATNKGLLPSTSMTSKNDFSGGGAVNATQSLSATAAVLVTDVLPNGNLVVEGVKMVKFSGETQYVVLHGVVRPDDITSANTIISSNIAGVRIEFISEGALTDAEKRGWISKLYNILRPY
jgi:flagellar L-ring protein precursor FlgH